MDLNVFQCLEYSTVLFFLHAFTAGFNVFMDVKVHLEAEDKP